MARRELGEINAGSMADIAFLLLIFFLVSTTMNTDSGISRQLSPIPDEDVIQDKENKIKNRNILTVLINKNNDLMVEEKPLDLIYLRETAKEFIENPNNKANLPEKELKDIEFFGQIQVSKQVISLQNDRGTSYGMYIKVQNELTAAYYELRDVLSMAQFGKKYSEFKSESPEAKAIAKIYPIAISEAEPVNIGGKK